MHTLAYVMTVVTRDDGWDRRYIVPKILGGATINVST